MARQVLQRAAQHLLGQAIRNAVVLHRGQHQAGPGRPVGGGFLGPLLLVEKRHRLDELQEAVLVAAHPGPEVGKGEQLGVGDGHRDRRQQALRVVMALADGRGLLSIFLNRIRFLHLALPLQDAAGLGSDSSRVSSKQRVAFRG